MHLPALSEISSAIRNLNPSDVRSQAERPMTFGVLAADELEANAMFDLLVPRELSEARAQEAGRRILRVGSDDDFRLCNVGFAESGIPHPSQFHRFESHRPQATIKSVLDDHEDDWLALARWFPAFRGPVVERIIWKISKENALFTVATAVPNVIPSVLSLPWAVGEFASDTAFLTMNQVRMAFLIAAACDRDVGYNEQAGQVGSIVAAAFGWRGLARQLVGKIPAGGGLITKGLISLAGTYAVGKSLEKFFKFGQHLTREERGTHYEDAYRRGRGVVEEIVSRIRRRDLDPASVPRA